LNFTAKIAISTTCAIIMAFSILFIFDFFQSYSIQGTGFSKIDIMTDPNTMMQIKFLSQHFDPNRNKIYLIGSSHLKPLNTTYIQGELLKNNQDFDVYNLALGTDSPKERLKSLDLLISSKPKIVVYGIAYRDFMDQFPSGQSENKPISILPDPHDFFNEIPKKLFSNYDLGFMENPEFVTLTAVKILEKQVDGEIKKKTDEDILVRPYPNALFNESKSNVPKNDAELKNMFLVDGAIFNEIGDYNKNENFIALKEIITKLRQNNIKIIIFITPQSKYYLNAMPSSVKTVFDTLIQNLEKDSKVKIYSLQDKYKDLNIWYDPQHVAIFNNTQIYSKDLSKIILEGIDNAF
jgi:hypothetical protein